MRYIKNPKYRIDKDKIFVTKKDELTADQLYLQSLREKKRITKRR